MSNYIITDGNRFIYKNYSGQYVPTKNEAMADFYTKKQAEGIYNNSLSKALKTIFYVKKYAEEEITKKQELFNNAEKVCESKNIQVWLNKIKDLKLMKEIVNRKYQLLQELKSLEDEQLDIEHYIEFQTLNAAQGYKAAKELKECRIKRRSVKNELLVLEIILEQNGEELDKRINGIDKRVYKPRVRTDLFNL